MRKPRPAAVALILAALVLAWPLGAMAEDNLADGLAALKRGEFETAFKIFLPLAQRGDAEAQCYLGLIYAAGLGVPQDYAEATSWFFKAAEQGHAHAQYCLSEMYSLVQDKAKSQLWLRKAAEQGHADAQCTLGVMYATGYTVRQDYTQAVTWYRKAAEQGNAEAQAYLGVHYYAGRGVPQDYAQAVTWYCRAAEQGHAEAQCTLAKFYANGIGVPQDYIQAHKWYNLAATTNEAGVREKAAAVRDLVAGQMTPAQIAEAQRLAREWRPKPEATPSAGPSLADPVIPPAGKQGKKKEGQSR